MIRQAYRKNPKSIIIVVGCLSQVESQKVAEIPGVSIVLGNKNKTKLVDYIKEYQTLHRQIIDIYDINKVNFECMKLDNFNKTRAFVKIQDGCNNFCSYCIIPYTRGDVRSKDRNDVLNEITDLVKNGHREIVLTGIHTGHYGSDLKNYNLANLLSEIILIKGVERVRISSIEITEITDDVLDIMSKSNIIVDHLHIPLQSGCDKTLLEMNRKYNIQYFKDKVARIRQIRPNISLTTDVIVGFPNESEEDFKETIANIKEINFSKIHVFPYSVRKGTKAENMPNQILENVKIDTYDKELEDGYLIGHTGNYLLIKCQGSIDYLNTDVEVTIIDIDYPYCLATLQEVHAFN